MAYCESEKEIRGILASDAKNWYQSKRCKSDKEFAEQFAKELLNPEKLYWLFAVRKITRCRAKDGSHSKSNMRTYTMSEHDGVQFNDTGSEKHICKRMFQKDYTEIGTIIDYETPIRNTSADTGYKGVDMLAYNERSNTMTLLETKIRESNETLLRAVLEVFTYWKVVDHQKLLYDFMNYRPDLQIDPFKTNVQKAVLLFEGSSAYEEYVNAESPYTVELMKKLGVEFFGIRGEEEYEVFVPEV